MIPVAPIKAWKEGHFHQIPILTGYNTNEGSMFVPRNISKGEGFTDFFKTLLPNMEDLDIQQLEESYPDPMTPLKDEKYVETRKNVGFQFTRLEQAYGHFAYVAPVLQTAAYASSPPLSDTANSNPPPPVYLYEFALPSDKTLLAFHGSHSGFVTRDPYITRRSKIIKAVSIAMHGYWTSFIVTGDPNAVQPKGKEQLLTWPRFEVGDKGANMLVFGEGNTELIKGKEKGIVSRVGWDGDMRKQCEIWMERTELFEE